MEIFPSNEFFFLINFFIKHFVAASNLFYIFSRKVFSSTKEFAKNKFSWWKTHFGNFQSVASGSRADRRGSGTAAVQTRSETVAVALQKITLCTYAFQWKQLHEHKIKHQKNWTEISLADANFPKRKNLIKLNNFSTETFPLHKKLNCAHAKCCGFSSI